MGRAGGAGKMKPAVFLDRDGVINRGVVRDGKPYPPDAPDQFELLPGVAEAVDRIRHAGFVIVVVTNQPDVATGKQERSVVEAMHEKLRRLLPVDDIRVCYHIDADECACRKPKPGMLLDAAAEWDIDLAQSVMVGDRWRDVGAGEAAGCQTVFIDYGYAEQRPQTSDFIAASLSDAVPFILDSNR